MCSQGLLRCCVLCCCLLRAALLLAACCVAACCVAGRGRGGARGLVWFCGPGVLRVVGWWCGSGREPCVGSRPGLLSGKSAVERDISTASIRQAKKAFGKAEIAFSAQRSGQRLYKSLAASVGVLWRCPTLPQPIGCSTIGAAGLSFQVRNVAGRFPGAVTTTRLFVQHHPPALCLGGVG